VVKGSQRQRAWLAGMQSRGTPGSQVELSGRNERAPRTFISPTHQEDGNTQQGFDA